MSVLAADAAPATVPPVSSSSAATEEETCTLTTAQLHAALSQLGHNRNGELVYKQCVLASLRLSHLPGLERYSNLQQLVLDHNALTELTAVRYMPQLVYLSARHNKLTSDVFDALAGAAECLERLHLDDNRLTSLSGLESLHFITDLTCSNNQIERVTSRCLTAAQRLMRLRLGHNCIAAIDVNAFDAARHLRALELDHNALTRVDFLCSVPATVESLGLADNRIAQLDGAIQHLVGLTVLDISRNALRGLEELRKLCSLTALRVLSFEGNADLVHLPQRATGSPASADRAMVISPPLSIDHTEYHAEVVMSDEEGVEEGEDGSDLRASRMTTSDHADEHSGAITPASTTEVMGSEAEGTAESHAPRSSVDESVGGGCGEHRTVSTATAAGAAAPTTAAYVVLAAPETYEFIRTVGSVARDAALSVKVDHAKEIEALPEEEQVYLWTLSILPHLREVNGRSIPPVDVARANFLFSAKTE